MALWETAKGAVEIATGVGRPSSDELRTLVEPTEPELFWFADDGETPNNSGWPLLVYRSAVRLKRGRDPATIFEDLFAANGWKDSWRDGIYDFLHFHTHRHEALGIARGHAQVRFGGAKGSSLEVRAGDVVVLPAGTGHRRLSASGDLLVVGAYPKSSGPYDQPRPSDIDHAEAVQAIALVRAPESDPVYGKTGSLVTRWR